jgi:sugar (pentulose or hexulose) kinase
MQNLYIGVDVSTTAAKALIIEADGAEHTVVARAQHAFEPLQTHADHPGRAEQVRDPHEHGIAYAPTQLHRLMIQRPETTNLDG